METEIGTKETACTTVELSEQGDIFEETQLHKITTTEDITNNISPLVKHKMVKTDSLNFDDIASVSEIVSEDDKQNNSSATVDGQEEKRSTLKRILRRRSNTCAQLNSWVANVLPKKRN